MSGPEDIVRADVTAALTDAYLDECGHDSRIPPKPLLYAALREIAEEKGLDPTEHELGYVAETNLAWVWRDMNGDLLDKAKPIKRREGGPWSK